MELSKAKMGMIILGVIALALVYKEMDTTLIQLCIVAISGLAGYEIRGQVVEMKSRGLEWHHYYWRVIGYFLAFGGGGLIFDELIHGPLEFWPITNHEVYGVIIGLIGLILISLKPHGK